MKPLLAASLALALVAAAPPPAAQAPAADQAAGAKGDPEAAAPHPRRSRQLRHRRQAPSPAARRVEAANRAASREPAGDGFVNAVQVYPWSEGALYRLLTAPEQVSDVALEPGEGLVAVAAGDTARWVIADTTSGSGAARRTHILVKPSARGLSTNLVVTTDRRVYRLSLESFGRTAMAGIAWTYPESELLALRRSRAAAEAAAPVADGLRLDSLNFGYAISRDRPAWRPLRAFDDGRQLFIELPEGAEAPPLFVVGEGGKAELVNYRLRGRFYVVDRLPGAVELRLGGRKQQVVRIARERPRKGKDG